MLSMDYKGIALITAYSYLSYAFANVTETRLGHVRDEALGQ